MKMLAMVLVVLLACAWGADCGSPCPAREDIYPCSCASVPLSKKQLHTVVSCHRLRDSAQLEALLPSLRALQIDHFQLYDSFWSAEAGKSGLPTDWLTLVKIREIEIVDTALDQGFACRWKSTCRNSITTKFSALNSTAHDKPTMLCDTGRGNVYPWTGCLTRLQHLTLGRSSLSVVGADFFPVPMNALQELDLSHNHIARVEKKALKNLPVLTRLDLSHNLLEKLDDVFDAQMRLQFLDISHNVIKVIGSTLIPSLPDLKVLKAESNLIEDLNEKDWTTFPDSLRNIDLTDNPVRCECDLQWLNTTLHRSALVAGTCASPPEFAGSALRRASRLLNERCDESGNIGTRPPKNS